MNKKFKRLVAVVGALSMLSSVSAAFAANTVKVTMVEVLPEGNESGKIAYENPATDKIKVNPSDLVRVTIDLKDAASEASVDGEVTFLSHLEGAGVLSNENIQYIDQQTARNGSVTVTFRPRPSLNVGDFIAMAGGEDVTEVSPFNYTVGQAPVQLTLQKGTFSVVEGSESDVTFTLEPKLAANVIESVKVGTTVQSAAAVNYEYDSNTGILTILKAGFDREPGTYTVTVSATGYTNAESNFEVTAKPSDPIPEGKEEEAKTALDAAIPSNSNGESSVTLEEKIMVDGKEYNVSYDVKFDTNKVTKDGNVYTLNVPYFAAKLNVIATAGGVAKNKAVYIVPASTAVNFGNLGLFSKADGSDAFDDDATVKSIIEDSNNQEEIAEELVIALNLALGRGDKTKDIPALSTLDYNGDTNITLAEYHIFKMLIKNQSGFKPSDIRKALGLTQ